MQFETDTVSVSFDNLKFSANADIDLSFICQDTSTYFDHGFGSALGHLIKTSLEGKLRINMDYESLEIHKIKYA